MSEMSGEFHLAKRLCGDETNSWSAMSREERRWIGLDTGNTYVGIPCPAVSGDQLTPVQLWQCAYENCTPSRVEEEPEFPNPSPDLLISSLERVLVSSRPVQRLFIYLRQISGWENPLESGLLMFAYFSFLISRCIPQVTVPFTSPNVFDSRLTGHQQITFIIVKVLYRHLCPPTIGDMHPQLVQSEDKTRQAEDLSELITKHGPRGWVDRLVEMAGPMLLYHSESLADTLEIIQKLVQTAANVAHTLASPRPTSLIVSMNGEIPGKPGYACSASLFFWPC